MSGMLGDRSKSKPNRPTQSGKQTFGRLASSDEPEGSSPVQSLRIVVDDP